MDLSSVIASFLTGTYTVTRASAGAYGSDGVYVPAGTSTLSAPACVQPITGRELQRLPEGLRSSEVRVFYTVVELRCAAPDVAPDRVSINGSTWQVERVEPWNELGNYFRCLVRKVP